VASAPEDAEGVGGEETAPDGLMEQETVRLRRSPAPSIAMSFFFKLIAPFRGVVLCPVTPNLTKVEEFLFQP
jgi:hypothetical protein